MKAAFLLVSLALASLALGSGNASAWGLPAGPAEARDLAQSPTAAALDHFLCYDVKPAARFKRRSVVLEDQFGTRKANVRSPFRLCNPVSKNGEKVRNARAHLLCYSIAAEDSGTKQVLVANQLEREGARLVAARPVSLCVPSAKSVRGKPTAPAERLDHYQCYAVKALRTAAVAQVRLIDQFWRSSDAVGPPETLCAPASKNSGTVVDPDSHLLCRLIKPKETFRARTVAVTNQFESNARYRAVRPRSLCLPSSKGGWRDLRQGTAEPQKSGEFRPFQIPPEEERNEDVPPEVPFGPLRGTLSPSDKASELVLQQRSPGRTFADPLGADASSAVTFFKNTSFQSKVAFAGVPPDMSGADNGQTVLASGNTFAALSTDGGGSFTAINPTTIFPSGATTSATGTLLDKGLCCDQVIVYVPKIDRFIWLMQFCGAGATCLQGTNKIRIAAASTANVAAGATSWTYWDLTSAHFGLDTTSNPNMDYPDLGVGNNYLYMSVDNVGAGLLVARIPLSEIAASATIHFDYTTPSDSATAYGGHLTQNVTNTEYWAGHIDNSTMRIFSLREGDGFYSWRSVAVNSWCNSDRSSITPGGTNDWLAFGFPSFAVLGSTQRTTQGRTELWFAWTAGHKRSDGKTCGFPQTHVQIAVIKASDFSLISQLQVWNQSIAFSYAALASNSANEIGMSLGYGGGGNEANHAVGFWGDFLVYSSTASTSSINRFGDYVTIRRSSPETRRFSAVGYGVAGGFDPHYVLFGR